ncbi:MAG TPA: succinate dehydrogenase, hydrophobic membrane anchor protein [Gammaproteobacteria bacterium]|nr:succinate dehydrogenase, hydrophobic membrane anchor protein [Gammaproteobacteria bacterium]
MSRRASGLKAWLLQRLSAVYIALYAFYFLFAMLGGAAQSHEAWRAWVGSPLPALAMVLFFIALTTHAWVGIRDVAVDYARPLWLRLSLLSMVGVILLGSLSGAVMALLSVR